MELIRQLKSQLEDLETYAYEVSVHLTIASFTAIGFNSPSFFLAIKNNWTSNLVLLKLSHDALWDGIRKW